MTKDSDGYPVLDEEEKIAVILDVAYCRRLRKVEIDDLKQCIDLIVGDLNTFVKAFKLSSKYAAELLIAIESIQPEVIDGDISDEATIKAHSETRRKRVELIESAYKPTLDMHSNRV